MPPAAPAPEPQSARAVLMVRPASFGFNAQTAQSNAFQQTPTPGADDDAASAALHEFAGLADALQRAGLEVFVAEDTVKPVRPDAIFPNNWVSFHADGTVVLYPLLAANRRSERREDILQMVARAGDFQITRTVDLSHREAQGKFLEGTGSLVLDRTHRIAYASLSPRTDLDVLGEFAQLLDYELVTFDAVAGHRAVYHTNVLMTVGEGFAVLCGAALGDAGQRRDVTEKLRSTDHEVIEISLPQMAQFAGNLLHLSTPRGGVVALSRSAWQSLTAAQRRRLETFGALLIADIPVIERFGGGSVRCMLAEIFLTKRELREVP